MDVVSTNFLIDYVLILYNQKHGPRKKKNELAGFWTSHTQGQTGGDASQTYKTDRRRLRWYPWTRSRSILLFYPTRVEKGCAALKIASHIIGKENEKS